MIVTCEKCKKDFDDEFRDTGCPHVAFPANDGHNNFVTHYDSHVSGGVGPCPICHSGNTFVSGGVCQCYDCGFSP